MNEVNFLPLGSVVILKGGIQKLMIVSRGIQVEHENRIVFFDYAGVIYPIGLVDQNVAYFNHSGIDEVIFEGYDDDDSKRLVKNMNQYLEEHQDIDRVNF